MPQCMGIKTDGLQCSRMARTVRAPEAPHLHFCATHWRTYDQRVEFLHNRNPEDEHHHVEGTCLWFGRRQWCGRPTVEGMLICQRHREVSNVLQQRLQAEADRRARIETALREYREEQPPMTWRQVVDAIFARTDLDTLRIADWFTIAQRYHLEPAIRDPEFNTLRHFMLYWRWRSQGEQGLPPNFALVLEQAAQPAPGRTLAAIARDNQNVHTRDVTNQTNRGLEKLVEMRQRHVGAMRAPDWFASKWLTRSFGHWSVVSRVVNDMYAWYMQPSCRSLNDTLYRRALDGLYLMIRSIPNEETKAELFKRTFEECLESVGMCCDGHMSRLCNVLVGFDETFAPPIPFGEILQSKMAAIAAQEISTDEKVRQATDFFNEFAVPEADRTAWLEAF